MTLAFGFIITNYILFSLGIVALWTSEAANPFVIIFSFLLLVILLFAEIKQKIPIIKGKSFYGFYIGPLTVAFLYFALGLPLLDTFCYVLLTMLFTRIIVKKEINDYLFCYIISLTCLLIGAMGTADFSFGFIFTAFFIVMSWSMILYQLRAEKEDEINLEKKSHSLMLSYGIAFQKEKIESSFFGLTSFLIFSSLLITMVIFFLMPRLTKGYITLYQNSGQVISGFTNEVELGDIGRIKLDQSVVMRIETFRDGKKVIPDDDIYWRGLALDHYDGRKWSNTFLSKESISKSGKSFYRIENNVESDEILRQEIYLESIDTDVIFTAGRPLFLSGPFRWMGIDYNNSLYRSDYPYGRVKFVVNSDFSANGRYRLSPEENEEFLKNREKYLQLPDLSDKFLNFTRGVVKGVEGKHRQAQIIESRLKTRFGYNLVQSEPEGISPIDHFLFVQKEGHCEYFASAMVLMLRASGTPSRLVNGFLRGEWNPVGEYLLVRQSHAHSWVEVLLDDKGWVAFDPTPAVAMPIISENMFVKMDRYMDALRMKWYRYIINYSWKDQASMARNVRNSTLNIKDMFNTNFSKILEMIKATLNNSAPEKKALYVILFVLILFVGKKLLSHSMLRWRKGPFYRNQASEIYLIMLTLLRKKGFKKGDSVTAREFVEAIKNDVGPAWGKIKTITEVYYETRFGKQELADEKRKELELSLKSLSSQMSN